LLLSHSQPLFNLEIIDPYWQALSASSQRITIIFYLIITGDAVCAFNPIYGQGMTVSAMDAVTLRRCLQEQQHLSNLII
jgi:2-polyprenyl-6-methoxyphenol hydroxylase-like FAD-dependent oxidoreductase